MCIYSTYIHMDISLYIFIYTLDFIIECIIISNQKTSKLGTSKIIGGKERWTM